jgi:phosphoserine phosphatase RsbU/P
MPGAVKKTTSKVNKQKLEVLLEITKAINFNQSTEDLLEKYQDFIKDNLQIEKLALFTNDSGWKCLLSYGVEKSVEKLNVEKNLIGYKEMSPLISTEKEDLKIFDIVIPVYHKNQPLSFLLIGGLYDQALKLKSTMNHLPFIQTLTNIIIVAIENKRLAKEKILQEGFKKELELASQMQSMLFPEKLPNDEKIEAAAFYQPQREVGGDYYDFIRLNDNESVFCMADVSGKGMSAALMMSNFQANMRALINNYPSLTELAKELNRKVMLNAKGEKFITMFIAKYNQASRIMHFLNAGHNPPILISGEVNLLLKTGSAGLGMFEELPKVKEGVITVAPGSSLLCYTDGVVELENEADEDYGVERLRVVFKENIHKPMKEINSIITRDLENFKGSNDYYDDIALLGCRFH